MPLHLGGAVFLQGDCIFTKSCENLLAIVRVPWYNVRSDWTMEEIMTAMHNCFFYSYYYFFIDKK
jgi:hypothetical protein